MKRVAALILLFALFVPLPIAAEEAACDPGQILPPCTCDGSCQLTDFVQLFINLYAFGVHLAAPLAVFFIIIGGVILVTASGYSNRIEMGKTMITQAVTGLIIVLVSWVIIDGAIFLLTGNRDHTVFGKKWFTTSFSYVCDDDRLIQGCQGSNVTALQRSLASLGYDVAADGIFGPQTAAAVRQFQTNANTNVYVTNGRTACGGTPQGLTVWNLVFEQICGQTGGICNVSSDVASAKHLTVTGYANRKTLDALTFFTQYVREEFKAACRSLTP